MTSTITIRVDDAFKNQLEDAARKLGFTQSKLVRRAVTHFVDTVAKETTETFHRRVGEYLGEAHPGTDHMELFQRLRELTDTDYDTMVTQNKLSKSKFNALMEAREHERISRRGYDYDAENQ
jgi:hypothetical protein